MSNYNTDISPAIQELKKLHGDLLEHIQQVENVSAKGMIQAKETVISILPGERRKEDGWYKWRMWQKKSDSILHELESSHKEEKYHEIYVSGESLSRTSEDIVLLMMHQVAHQSAQIQSIQSYHAEWIKIWHQRLFQVPQDAWTRDEVLGWYTIDKTKLGSASTLVSRLAKGLDATSFDLFRVKLTKHDQTGKMNKWLCDCGTPAVRTGGVLYATCEKCSTKFKLITKGVRDDFLRRVPNDLKREP